MCINEGPFPVPLRNDLRVFEFIRVIRRACFRRRDAVVPEEVCSLQVDRSRFVAGIFLLLVLDAFYFCLTDMHNMQAGTWWEYSCYQMGNVR